MKNLKGILITQFFVRSTAKNAVKIFKIQLGRLLNHLNGSLDVVNKAVIAKKQRRRALAVSSDHFATPITATSHCLIFLLDSFSGR